MRSSRCGGRRCCGAGGGEDDDGGSDYGRSGSIALAGSASGLWRWVWKTATGRRITSTTAWSECQSWRRADWPGRHWMRGLQRRDGLLPDQSMQGIRTWGGGSLTDGRRRRTRSPPKSGVSRISGFFPRGETRIFSPPWNGRVWRVLCPGFSPDGFNRTQKVCWVRILPPSV
jgi:hypothetical protein